MDSPHGNSLKWGKMSLREQEDALEVLLLRWASWCNSGSGVSECRGYPHETPIARCIRLGPAAGHAGRSGGYGTSTDCEAVEKIINRMPVRSRKAVVYKYVHGVVDVVGAMALHTSKATFQRRVQAGRDWLLLQDEIAEIAK